MDKFLGFKTEEIITCLLLVVVGYFIAKMFSERCGCNGFSIGGAYGGSDCGGLYDPNDNTTYCSFRNDASLKYKCNTSPVCNSFTKGECNGPDSLCCNDPDSPYFGLQKEKCPSMNQPPPLKIRSRDKRDNVKHFCGDNPQYLSNHRDLIISGGDTIGGPPYYVDNVWEGSDRCWSTSIIPQPPAPAPAPAPPAPNSDVCNTPEHLDYQQAITAETCDMSDISRCVTKPGATKNCKDVFENYYHKCWSYIEANSDDNIGAYLGVPQMKGACDLLDSAPAPAPTPPGPSPTPPAPTCVSLNPFFTDEWVNINCTGVEGEDNLFNCWVEVEDSYVSCTTSG